MSVVFSPRAYLAGAGNGFYFGFSDRYAISFYSPSGQLRRFIRRNIPTRPLPSSAIEAYKTRRRTMPDFDGRPPTTQRRAMIERELQLTVFSKVLPAFSKIAVDRMGNLWVNQYGPWADIPQGFLYTTRTSDVPTRWDVFDPEGRWWCTVTLPTAFAPLDIGSDYVAGVWRDQDDVEHVRLYRLIKP
jgi:hypothetical protein